MKIKSTLLVTILLASIAQISLCAIDTYQFDNPRQEAQYRALIDEFRCPKCQNQNLAGSDAPIAQDLKQKTYDMVKDGRSDSEIRNYMNERYGDFISYKPPVRPSTWILWFLPPIILVLALLGWGLRQRYRRKPPLVADESETTIRSPNHTYENEPLATLSESEQQRLDKLLGKNDIPHVQSAQPNRHSLTNSKE